MLMVIGRRPPAVDGPVIAPPAESFGAEVHPVSADGRGLGSAGHIFISDGYCNNRVVKYDKNGRFVAQAGSEKAGTALGEFNLPHGLQVDERGHVWVRIGRTTATGARQQSQPIKEVTNLGTGWTLCISRARTSTCSSPIRIRTVIRRDRGQHRRNLQGRARWKRARQVRQAREESARIPSRSHARLPQSERSRPRRDRIVACPEIHPAAVAVAPERRPLIRERTMTHASKKLALTLALFAAAILAPNGCRHRAPRRR